MKITVATNESVFNLEVSPEMEIINLKALISLECNVDSEQIVLVHNGKVLLDNDKTLVSYSIVDGDVLMVSPAQPTSPSSSSNTMPNLDHFDFSNIRVPDSLSSRVNNFGPHIFYKQCLDNPLQLASLRQFNPPLAAAFDKGFDEFKKVFEEQIWAKTERDRMRLRMALADPFDVESQRMIQEEIYRENIKSNLQTALEHHPESFGMVSMLFINCKVNGFPVKAFIDSGAQSTIMSSACAARCNITRLIDTNCAGIAKGVGTQKIIGKVHLGQIQIENDFLPSSFTVLEGNDQLDFLLGLDMLKRHQCVIDLKNNVLIIGTTGTKTPFLPENEIPDSINLY